jgi:hypothetical protein
MLGQAFEHAEVKAVAPVPALDGATGQAERGEGHHALGSKNAMLPMPSQVGQAPMGELNENNRGSSSLME